MLRRCVWSRNIKNGCSIYIYIYDISHLRVKWTRPLLRKTKSGFCACAITFQTQSTHAKELRYSSNKRQGGPPGGSERFGEEENLLPLPGVGTPASPSRILVTIPTELPRLPTNQVCWHKRPTVYHQSVLSHKMLIQQHTFTSGRAVEVHILLACCAASIGDWWPTFRDIHVTSSSRVETSKGRVPAVSLR